MARGLFKLAIFNLMDSNVCVAQLVEQSTEVMEVTGLIPGLGEVFLLISF